MFIISIFTLFAVIGCKSKKAITSTLTKIDTVKVFKDRIIEKPIERIVKIEEPCDSLGLKPIDKEIITKYVTVKIKGERDTLFVQTNIDSIIQQTIIKEKLKWDSEFKVETKYRIAKWSFYSLGVNLLLIIITFRKFIPLLKFLPF